MNNGKAIKTAIFALIAAIILSACGYFIGKTAPAEPKNQDLAQVVQKAERNVAEVKCGSSIATAFVFEKQGDDAVIVTCWHTVKSDPQVAEFKFSGESTFTKGARLLGYDADYDVAVYLLGTDKKFDTLAVADNAQQGEDVFLLGNSKGEGVALFCGKVAMGDDVVLCRDQTPNSNIDAKSLPAVRITAAINYGSSGAPVFDASGALVGMGFYQVFGTTERPVYDMNYAVPSVIIRSLIKAYGLKSGATQRSAVTLSNYIKGEGENALRVYEAKFKSTWEGVVFTKERDGIYGDDGQGKKRVVSLANVKPVTMAQFLAAAIDCESLGGELLME